MRGLALLPALWLFISVLALHVGARLVPTMFEMHDTADLKGERDDPECGPLQKHRYRCNPPLTRIQANSGLTPTDTDAFSIQGLYHLAPTKIDSSGADGETEGITDLTSGAADHVGDSVEVVAMLPSDRTPTPEGNRDDPDCGPLGKHRYRCNPPLTRIQDNAVVP